LFTGSLVEIEYTLNVHPLTRVTDPHTLNIGITQIVYIKMFVIEVSAQLYVLMLHVLPFVIEVSAQLYVLMLHVLPFVIEVSAQLYVLNVTCIAVCVG